jgi:hypothetical protein
MSFLDLQDLATVAAQADLCHLLALWCSEDADVVLHVIETGTAGGLAALLLRRRGRR